MIRGCGEMHRLQNVCGMLEGRKRGTEGYRRDGCSARPIHAFSRTKQDLLVWETPRPVLTTRNRGSDDQ